MLHLRELGGDRGEDNPGSRDAGLTPPLGCRPFLRMTTVPFCALSTFPTRHSPPQLTWWWDTRVTVLKTQWGRLRKLGAPKREPQWPSLPHSPAFSKAVVPGTWDKRGPNPQQSKGQPRPWMAPSSGRCRPRPLGSVCWKTRPCRSHRPRVFCYLQLNESQATVRAVLSVWLSFSTL